MVYVDSDALYEILGGFFQTLTTAPEGQLIHRVGGAILFEYNRPKGKILWVPAGEADTWPAFEVRVGTEADGVQPLLTFVQDGDLAHKFWLGEVDLAEALARQQLKAIGPLSRAMKLLPHLDPVYERYRAYAVQRGVA